jgi:hypothetical protein
LFEDEPEGLAVNHSGSGFVSMANRGKSKKAALIYGLNCSNTQRFVEKVVKFFRLKKIVCVRWNELIEFFFHCV